MMYLIIFFAMVLSCVYFANAAQNCNAAKFSCQFNNPCDPLCPSAQEYYPGKMPWIYVQCGPNGQCTEHRCPRHLVWHQNQEECLTRGGLELRCAQVRFDCSDPDKNPCSPTLCRLGVHNYPGKSPSYWVNCPSWSPGRCDELNCGPRKVFDYDAQGCVPKNDD